MKIFSIIILLFVLFYLFPPTVSAHAFGQIYNLPVPVWTYLSGAGAVVVLSFIASVLFLGKININKLKFEREIKNNFFRKIIFSGNLQKLLGTISAFFLFVLVVAGFIGTFEPVFNLLTLWFWIIFLLGFTYTISLIGNFWTVINPWENILSFLEYVTHKKFNGELKFPEKYYKITAVFFYLVLLWLELLSLGLGTNPRSLSVLLVLYSLFNLFGGYLLGKRIWFNNFELFGVMFGLLSHNSILYIEEKRIFIRIPFSGLLTSLREGFPVVLLILLVLAGTAFDGFRSTTEYFKVLNIAFSYVGNLTVSQENFFQLLILLSFWLVFFLAYVLVIYLMKVLTKFSSVKDLIKDFALSLLPIAFVYNVAHYFTLLLIQGQVIISLISDPFNMGWNLFGTGYFKVNVGVIGAKTVWEAQVFLIVLGHVVAVLVAHVIAIRIFKDHKKALISQIPMLLLMVGYTIFGLWILSQPFRLGG